MDGALKEIKKSMMSKRAIHIGVCHWHKCFCIHIENNNNT